MSSVGAAGGRGRRCEHDDHPCFDFFDEVLVSFCCLAVDLSVVSGVYLVNGGKYLDLARSEDDDL
jgi:GTP:adenosylcobinamide-phosphate guanylyltransferase